MTSFFKTKISLSLLYPSLIALFLILCFFFLVILTRNSVKNISLLKDALAARKSDNQSFLLLTASKDAAALTSSRLGSILPITDNLIKLPQDIKALGATLGVNAALIFGNEREGKAAEPGSIIFTLIAESSDPQALLAFLHKLETSRYLIHFDKVNRGKNGINYKIIVNGQIYTQ
ncbi:MAG: hypothetical protein FJY91_00145 [Candidatus Harrisonbacteria bacterium]|nr:hypothetical protein [Candidatus Harrisonbacteria bacterium]